MLSGSKVQVKVSDSLMASGKVASTKHRSLLSQSHCGRILLPVGVSPKHQICQKFYYLTTALPEFSHKPELIKPSVLVRGHSFSENPHVRRTGSRRSWCWWAYFPKSILRASSPIGEVRWAKQEDSCKVSSLEVPSEHRW